jgi:hypothetical protein
MPSPVDICNQALAEIFSASIASMDERSVEAQACTTFYEPTLTEMLEGHPWSFANKRVQLASIVNPRPVEWGFAYSLPTDCAKPLRIVPDFSTITAPPAYYGPWGEWPDRGFPWDHGLGRFYDLQGDTIYANVDAATLDYVSTDVNRLPALFSRALVLELASRIVAPLKKSRELKGDLIKQAEVAKARAMAEDMNRQPQENDASYRSEAERAREGWGR